MSRAVLVVVRREVRHAALARVGFGAPQLLLGDLLVGYGLDDVRAGDEHVARVLGHEDEVGDGRRVDGAAGARPHDGRDLRHHARSRDVVGEDPGIAVEADDPFLDTRAARVVDAQDRRAVLHGHFLDLADLVRHHPAQAAAEHGEVLGVDKDVAAFDGARSRDHGVARDLLVLHVEVGAVVGAQPVQLHEAPLVQQDLDAFPRQQLAFIVLPAYAHLAPAKLCPAVQFLQSEKPILYSHLFPLRGKPSWRGNAPGPTTSHAPGRGPGCPFA